MGITNVHKIRMFPLSLTGAAFNWFTSLPPNSIDSWVSLEQKFHDYFYNGGGRTKVIRSHILETKVHQNCFRLLEMV
jgi:hypothetical protein